jgi:hypothetical protein
LFFFCVSFAFFCGKNAKRDRPFFLLQHVLAILSQQLQFLGLTFLAGGCGAADGGL